jgi:DNA-binding transcriptional LysR family regulator
MLRMVFIIIHNDCMSRNLDIALLRTFVAVADHCGMTAAGNALNLTQSAVSQQIARLEDLTGKLFQRDRRALRLSGTGERLLSKARRIISLNDELWTDISGQTIEGRVRLGAPYDLVGTWLTPILRDYAERNPRVDVALVCQSSPELVAATESGHVDIAIVEEHVGKTGDGERLAVDRLVWVGARAGNAHLKSPIPVSLVAETCAFRPAVLEALWNRNLEWRTMFESGSIDATCATVRTDLAITAWLESTVPSDLNILRDDERLPALPDFAINLYQSSGSPSHAAAELAKSIRHGVPARGLMEMAP